MMPSNGAQCFKFIQVKAIIAPVSRALAAASLQSACFPMALAMPIVCPMSLSGQIAHCWANGAPRLYSVGLMGDESRFLMSLIVSQRDETEDYLKLLVDAKNRLAVGINAAGTFQISNALCTLRRLPMPAKQLICSALLGRVDNHPLHVKMDVLPIARVSAQVVRAFGPIPLLCDTHAGFCAWATREKQLFSAVSSRLRDVRVSTMRVENMVGNLMGRLRIPMSWAALYRPPVLVLDLVSDIRDPDDDCLYD